MLLYSLTIMILRSVRIGDNGWYVPEDGSIHIDLYAGADGKGTMLFTAAHELTHFIKDQSPEKFQALSDFLMEQYGKKGVPVQALVEEQMAKARKHGNALDPDGAFEEVVADSMESMLTDGKVLQELKQRDKGLWQTVKDYVLELCEKIRKVYKRLKPDSLEGRMVAEMKDAAEEMRRLFVEGLQDAAENFTGSEGQKNTTQEGGVKMSIRSVNGNDVAWIEENIMKENRGEPTHQFIANYIAEHIGEMYTIIESGQKVFLGEDLPGEYTQSKYTQKILKNSPSILKVKNRAVANLGEMIEIATNRRWEKTRHPKSKDAKYGMYRYDTRIGFPVKNLKGEITGANIYNAELLIRNASDGKKYLYDIVSIKKDTTSSDWLTKKAASAAAFATGQMGDVSIDSIHSTETDVKKKFSIRDQDVRKMNDVLEKQNKKLREDVASLKELLRMQKSVTGGKLFKDSSMDSAAKYLMKNAGAKGDVKEFNTLLRDVYGYIVGGEEVTWDEIMERAEGAANWLEEHREQKHIRDPYADEVLREIRGSRITLDESQKAGAEYQFGIPNCHRLMQW